MQPSWRFEITNPPFSIVEVVISDDTSTDGSHGCIGAESLQNDVSSAHHSIR